MANTVSIEFAGDAGKLAKASKVADDAIQGVGDQSVKASKDMQKSTKSSGDLLDRFSKLGNATEGMASAIDNASGVLDDLSRIQSASYEKSQAQKRALNQVDQSMLDVTQAAEDLKQAQSDLNQSVLDGQQALIDKNQAQIDEKQALVNASKAQQTLNDDVKKHGKNSIEARQDQIDLAQATADLSQANLDAKQAGEDFTQSQNDASQALVDGKQAAVNAKGAQLDLSDAQRAAHPPAVDKWSQQLQTYAPLLSSLVGITSLVTGAQWLWNAAQAASPTTWIVAGIIALVAVIVLIATKTHWFQNIWKVAWGAIKSGAEAAWNFIKKIPGWIGSAFAVIGGLITRPFQAGWNFVRKIPGWISGAFSTVAAAISRPFRAAFNFVSDAWNNTIGRLSWTIPGWIPGIGGNTISVPHLPRFHTGGVVPGRAGQEVPIMAMAGETVTPAGAGGMSIRIESGGTQLDDLLVEILSRAVRRRGGDVQLALGGSNG